MLQPKPPFTKLQLHLGNGQWSKFETQLVRKEFKV